MTPTKDTRKPAKCTASTAKKLKGFTDEERAAMEERAQELKAEARAIKNKADGESDVLAKIADMPEPDRAMAKRLHAIIKASAPSLSPKTWYGMPAYANKDGKVVCFFQSAQKFKSRYATFGFTDAANLDEGAMWPTSFALKELTAAEEARLDALDPGHSIKPLIEADDLPELEPLHEYGVIGVGERDVEVDVEIEDLAEAALARKNDPRQLYQGEKTIPDFASGYPVLPLKDENRLEDDRVGQSDLDLAALDPGEEGRRS